MGVIRTVRLALLLSLATACGGPRTTTRITAAGATRPAPSIVVRDEAEAPPPRAWLWEVQGDGAPPSYLLGTMHIGVRLERALPAPLDTHLHDARAVLMEIDLREAQRMFASGPRQRVPRRQWLDRTLPPSAWAALVQELGDRVPPEVLRQLPPAVLALYLQQVRMAEVEAVEEGREPVRGAASSAQLDASIFDWTIRRGTQFAPLETPEEAMAALTALADGSAIEALTHVLDEAEAARGEERALRDAYLAFDEGALLALLSEEMTPEVREVLLVGRNRAWMPHLLPELRQGGVFVAVGVGHLVGEDSVVTALRAEGFTVRRLGAP